VDQLMLLGQNLGSGLFKPEDYFAQLQSMNNGNQEHIAAHLAHNVSFEGMDDMEGSPGANADKPLTSKFR